MRQPYYLMRLLVCCALLAGNLHAQIATSPLTTQAWVAPNVVVTLDDSPSMEQECIPGGLCSYETNKFNDEPLVAGSVVHYLNHDVLGNGGITQAIAAIPYGDNPVFGGVVTYDASNLLARQARSVSTNPSYYDPTKRYDPWPSDRGLDFANADPRKAYYHPGDSRITHPPLAANTVWTTAASLSTFDLTLEQTMRLKFCTTTSLSACTESTQTFKPAQYFKLINGNGTQVSDFQRIIITDTLSFPKSRKRTDCTSVSNGCTQDEELRNFANWYSYHMPAQQNSGDRFIVYTFTYDATNLKAVQLRSPSFNPAYYNPTRRYKPWVRGDFSAYPNSTPSAAPYNPLNPSYTLDLTQRITAYGKFCTDIFWSKCPPAREEFWPAQYYLWTSGNGTSTSHFTHVIIGNNNNQFTKYTSQTNPKGDRTDCAGDTCTRAEELQNFANWFTYYRTKWLAAKAAISQTFKAIPGAVRLGYGSISVPLAGNTVDGEQTGVLVRGVRPFVNVGPGDTARSDFYDWLLNLNSSTNQAGTPLRRAMIEVGNYYMRDDGKGPWAAIPGGNSTEAHTVCRRALHLMITDGAWTQSDASQLTGVKTGHGDRSVATYSLLDVNVDGSYGAPFADTYPNTLADVAMYYWKTNLRSDLSGAVKSPQSEKDLGRDATWPHMVNYLISFGVNGTLRNNPDDPSQSDRAALQAGGLDWPKPEDEATKLDDMWHAAWNSGGSAFNANDPKQLNESLGKVIESMKEQVGSDAPLVLPSRFVSSDYVYIPSYKSKVWSGDLFAYPFDRITGDRSQDSDGNYLEGAWSAARQLRSKNASDRNIFTFDGSNRREFTYQGLNTVTNNLIGRLTTNSAQAEDLINYLRGDASNEGTRYRPRPDGKLGDIVNSPPILVYDAEDASYDFLKTPAAGSTRGNYRQFLLDKKKRRGLVFAGANDGMLHAFNAQTGDEEFAYIPKTVFGDLYRLSEPGYDHRYFVDGPLVEADVYDNSATPSDSDTGWRNILVGTGGAGGRNVFAIRVPVRSNGDANTTYPPTAQDILWEINSDDSNFADLGHVLQKPAVGMMRDGTWVVVVGNGYVNSDGKATLYIINALTGAFIKSIAVTSTGNNGLGGVRMVLDLERQIVAAYAGDLQGNLWKFDFSSESSNNWGVAFGGLPLFKAKYAKPSGGTTIDQAQPITAAPAYLAHPQGGNLLVFGTGKLFETTDSNNTDMQTLYAVWDKVITGQASGAAAATATRDSPTGDAIVLRSNLVEQTMTAIAGTNYYSATNNLVNYPSQRGWFIKLNMTPSGLRLIFPPQLAVGKVFLQTLAPPGSTTDPCAEIRGKSVSFIVNPFSGSASAPTFDVNSDGKIDTADASYASSAINAVAVASNDTSNATFSQKVGAGVSTGALTSATGQKTVTGAKNALRRTWRQIINRPTPAATIAPAGGS